MNWKIRERLERTTGRSGEPQDDFEKQENERRESTGLPRREWLDREDEMVTQVIAQCLTGHPASETP